MPTYFLPIAGVRVVAMATGAREGPIETATTVMVSHTPRACGGSSASFGTLCEQHSDHVTVFAHKGRDCPFRSPCQQLFLPQNIKARPDQERKGDKGPAEQAA